MKAALSGMLAPTLRETFLGNAEIREVFNITKVGKVAGCRVTEGMVERGAKVRLIRDNVVIHEGTLKTLKRFKDEVREVHGRPGVRHGVRELPGHPGGRRHRVPSRSRRSRAALIRAATEDLAAFLDLMSGYAARIFRSPICDPDVEMLLTPGTGFKKPDTKPSPIRLAKCEMGSSSPLTVHQEARRYRSAPLLPSVKKEKIT